MLARLLLTAVIAVPMPLWAQDVALILGQERYEQLDRVVRADDILGASDRLNALGFDVFALANGRVGPVRDLARSFQAGAAGADRLVVALSGHFVTDGARSWLLSAEADQPDLFDVDQAALSLDSVLLVLGSRPGQAVLLLGVADRGDLDLADTGLRAGLGDLAIPQGVTVIETNTRDAASLLRGVVTEPEANLGAALAGNRSVDVSGFAPDDWVFMPPEVIIERTTPEVTADDPALPTAADLNAEAALWDRATGADTVEAYRAYIASYPQGRFASEAETQIRAILSEPNRAARLAEDALNLTRSDRRAIQSNLTVLDYNTRGVDGIFGPGSRGAITNWQQTNGFPQTSYLSRDQINQLDAQAARRQAELDAEAAREQALAEERDRIYWTETGALGDEPGYRAYLDRYPDGVFANIAKARLSEIEDRRRVEAETADRASWAIAQSQDNPRAYQEYLTLYPDGVFADQAQARLAELTTPQVSDAQRAQARAQEQSLRLSGVRAQLLELRLRDLGHNPGRLDGVIDADTRAAIAAYQESQGVAATGYVDQATAVGLMTGSINITIPGR